MPARSSLSWSRGPEMLQRLLLTVALLGGALHWLSRNSRERRRTAPPAHQQSKSTASLPTRTPCECWHVCKPIVRKSATLAIRSWSGTASDSVCVVLGARTNFFRNELIMSPVGSLNLAGARPPRLTAKLSKPRCPPGGALLLEPTAHQIGRRN